MSKIKGEYTPTEQDHEMVKQWIEKFHESCFPVNTTQNCKWDQETYNSLVRLDLCITGSNSFYKSVFPFIMKTHKGPRTVQLKIFKMEKDFKKFIYNSEYLIHRCLVGHDPLNGKKLYACYYHKDFGKVGWLKGRLQFVLQKLCSKRFLYWFYDIDKINLTSIQINITNKCDD